MTKFVALYDRYRTYADKKIIQFEGKRFSTDDPDIIAVLRKDRVVQEVKDPDKEPKGSKAKA